MWKKFYKKATALALVCAMSVMLTACGDSNNSSWNAAASSLEDSVEDAIAQEIQSRKHLRLMPPPWKIVPMHCRIQPEKKQKPSRNGFILT